MRHAKQLDMKWELGGKLLKASFSLWALNSPFGGSLPFSVLELFGADDSLGLLSEVNHP